MTGKTKAEIHNEPWVRAKENLVRFTFGLANDTEDELMGESSEILEWIDKQSPDAGAKIRKAILDDRVVIYSPRFDPRGSDIGIFLVSFAGGHDFPNHFHDTVHATIYITEGAGDVYLDGKKIRLTKGDTINIPMGTSHEFFADTDGLTYLAVTTGSLYNKEQGTYDWTCVAPNRPDE